MSEQHTDTRTPLLHPWTGLKEGHYDFQYDAGRDLFRVEIEAGECGLQMRFPNEANATPINELSPNTIFYVAEPPSELDKLRADLAFQLSIPDELDWDYFLETAMRAKEAADAEGRNMTP